MASQDTSSEPGSREEVVDARILRLSSVIFPRLDPHATLVENLPAANS
jgi:hypothetical protein